MRRGKARDESLLAGRFAYERELGRGGGGRVLLAVDRAASSVRRALKVVAGPRASRLAVELDALTAVVHPSLVRAHDLFVLHADAPAPFALERGTHVLVEDFVDGESVEAALGASASSRRVDRASEVVRDLARALTALHAHGLVHGDVSTSNVLVERDSGRAILVDLGAAGPPGPAGALDGAPAFFAPERFAGERGFGADLFALGVVWLALLGAPPERGSRSMIDWLAVALSHVDRVPALLDGDAAVCLRSLLAPEPEARPARAADVVRALERVPRGGREGGTAVEGLISLETPAEREARLTNLPRIGNDGALRALVEALGAVPPRVDVVGARGAGRSRLIRDAVREFQRVAYRAGARVPVYVSDEAFAEGVEQSGGAPTALVLHVASRPALESAAALVRTARLAGADATVIYERTPADVGAPESAPAPCGGDSPEVGWPDAGSPEVGSSDAGSPDARSPDAGSFDAGAAVGAASVAAGRGRAGVAEDSCPDRDGPAIGGGGPDVAEAGASREATHGGAPVIEVRALDLAEREALIDLAVGRGRSALHAALAQVAPTHAGTLVRALVAASKVAAGEPRVEDVIEALGAEREFQARTALAFPAAYARGLATLAVLGGELPAADAAELVPRRDLAAFIALDLVRHTDGGRVALHDEAFAHALERTTATRATLFFRGGELDLEALASDVRSRPARSFLELVRGEPEAEAQLTDWLRELLGRGELDRAIVGAARALSLARREVPSFAWWKAEALRRAGRYDEAQRALGRPQTPDAWVLAAEIARLRREAAAVRELVATAPESVADCGAMIAVRARAALDAGEHGEARALAERAERAGASRAGEVLAWLELVAGRAQDAAKRAFASVDACRAAGDRTGVARALSVAASASAALSRRDEALALHLQSYEAAHAIGERHVAARCLVNVGLARAARGELGPARAALLDGTRELLSLGLEVDAPRPLLALASVAGLSGDVVLAERSLTFALEAGRADVAASSFARVGLAELALERGRATDAATWLDAAWETSSSLASRERAVSFARGAAVWATLGRDERCVEALAALFGESRPASPVASARDGSGPSGDVTASGPGFDVTSDSPPNGAGVLGPAGPPHAGSPHAGSSRGAEAAAFDAYPVDHETQIEIGLARLAAGRMERPEIDRLRACAREAAFEAALRVELSVARSAAAEDDAGLHHSALAEARALLDRASATLEAPERERMQRVPRYDAALRVAPAETRARVPLAVGDVADRFSIALQRVLGVAPPTGVPSALAAAALELVRAERAVLVRRGAREQLEVLAACDRVGVSDSPATEPRTPSSRAIPSRAVVGRVFAEGAAVSLRDALRDRRFRGSRSVHALAMRSVAAVPLALDGRVDAVLLVEDRVRPVAFSTEDVRALADLAGVGALAMSRAALLASERESRRRAEVLARRVTAERELRADRASSRERLHRAAEEEGGFVARSLVMQELVELVHRVARSDAAVLVTGESGTGKGLVARELHRASPRADGPFVVESCAAIPASLLESALFGHARGAFTGADRAHVGLFERAHGGTLFLDEIAELAPALQPKLLRALESGEIWPVGAAEPKRVDVRVVTATHRDLPRAVETGAFREDLFYRVAKLVVTVPPLRERHEDLLPLLGLFAARYAEPDRPPPAFDEAALARLASYSFPGNVRELENEVRRVLLVSESVVEERHLSPRVLRAERGERDLARGELDLHGRVRALERTLVTLALTRAQGNRTHAARFLGITRFGLQKMLRRLDLERGEAGRDAQRERARREPNADEP